MHLDLLRLLRQAAGLHEVLSLVIMTGLALVRPFFWSAWLQGVKVCGFHLARRMELALAVTVVPELELLKDLILMVLDLMVLELEKVPKLC